MNDNKINGIKDQIIRQSMKLFLAKGYRGTSVKEITEASGVAKGTLYWYFKSKDEILQSILEKFDAEFVDALVQIVAACDGDFITKYSAFHKHATEFARDNRDLALVFNALLNEIVGTNTKGERIAKAVYEKFRRVVEGMLEEGKQNGSLRPNIDPVVYAHIILASHTGMLVQWFVTGESINIPVFTKHFRNFIIRGVTTGKD